MRKWLIAFILFVFTFSPVQAATRLRLENATSPVSIHDKAKLKVRIMQDETDAAGPISGEKVEFKLKESKEGVECKASTQTSNTDGYVEGECTSTTVGKIIVYAQSIDKADSSNEVEISFEDIPVTPTPASQTSQMSPAQRNAILQQQQMQRQQQTGGGVGNPLGSGEGLVQQEERDDGLTQADEEVVPTGQVMAVRDDKQDVDLLISLIFLVAGLVLLIGGTYAVLMFIRHPHQKKENTTQPTSPPPESSVDTH